MFVPLLPIRLQFMCRAIRVRAYENRLILPGNSISINAYEIVENIRLLTMN